MTLARWKLLAGVFGISMVGLVAVANPQCPGQGKTDPARETAPPSREVQTKPKDSPVTYAVAIPAADRAAPPPSLPTVAPIPALPSPTPTLEPIALPKVEFSPTIPPIVATPAFTPSLPAPVADRVIELPLPGVTAVKPTQPVPDLRVELPKVQPEFAPPVVRVEPKSIPVDVVTLPERATPAPITPLSLPTPTPTPFDVPTSPPVVVEPSRAVSAVKEEVETRVRVVVPLGKSQAKFDVLAGDTVLLQAVCEQVEVRTPSEKGGAVSPIKATGKVRFTAPGCEGTCDSLAVLPNSGEVELTGTVRVVCKHGKAETEIQATTMKFKLGSAPAAPATIPPTLTPTAVR